MAINIPKILAMRPENAVKKLGSASKVLVMNSKDIINAIKDKPMIVMACNIRIKHAVPGIMRAAEELDAIVGYELAKSEGDLDGGYTGQTPQIFFDMLIEYAERLKFSKPFFIHGDHITVKSTAEKDVESARKLIAAELEAGYTSFAIDASFNEIPDNIKITVDLAKPIIAAGIGLEGEVGEIKLAASKDEESITTVEEAVEYVSGVFAQDTPLTMLAINNGAKHGNYLEGFPVHIDLERTGEIYNAVKKYGVVIAQHGITGTPLEIIGRFADYGIRKGNVGTHWQNVVHKHLPPDLFSEMKKWAEANKKDIKFTTKVFKKEIASIPEKYAKAIEDEAYITAKEFITAFRAPGSATYAMEKWAG